MPRTDEIPPPIQADGDVAGSLPPAENHVFYPALDGLRAAAVLAVFAHHYLPQYFDIGWVGVDFFFVLSGFLITGILFDTRFRPKRFKTFYIRRILRIFPLYYGVLLVCMLLYPVFHWIWQPSWLFFPAYLSDFNRFVWPLPEFRGAPQSESLVSALAFHTPFSLRLSHLWSLAVEEQFYLLWPPIVFLVMDRVRLRNLCIGICVAVLAARCVCAVMLPQSLLDQKLLYLTTPFRVDALIIGGLLALLWRGPEIATIKRLAKPLLVLAAVVIGGGQLAFLVRAGHTYPINISSRFVSTIGYTSIDVAAAMVILLALNPGGILYRVFSFRPLAWLGRISYGFYIFHQIPHTAYGLLAHRLQRSQGDVTVLTAAIALVATLLLATVSFYLYEKPFLRLKSRFAA